MIDLTGHWRFFEEFSAGFDDGIAVLKQEGSHVKGYLMYTEYIYDDMSFEVLVEVDGMLEEDQLSLLGQSATLFNVPEDIEYCVDDRMAVVKSSELISGNSVDSQNLEGRFVLRRMDSEKIS